MGKRSKSKAAIVAEVCLYGTRAVGFSYLARLEGGPLLEGGGIGDEKRPGTFGTCTEAVWSAVRELRIASNAAGRVLSGTVAIFEPNGRRALADVDRVPAFGELAWEPTAGAALVVRPAPVTCDPCGRYGYSRCHCKVRTAPEGSRYHDGNH